MRILRKHDSKIESCAGYTCIKCAGEEDQIMRTSYGIYEILSPTLDVGAAHRVYDNLFCNWSGIGGYSVIFTTDQGDVFCAECAKRAFILDLEEVTADCYDEGPTMCCDGCNREITSSYGDPDEDSYDNVDEVLP